MNTIAITALLIAIFNGPGPSVTLSENTGTPDNGSFWDPVCQVIQEDQVFCTLQNPPGYDPRNNEPYEENQ